MAIGGKLTVGSTYETQFEVSFARNIKITNYSQREMGEKGDVCATVQNGNRGYAECIYSDGKKSEKLASMDLQAKRYIIFDELRRLDGNENDLTEQDLAKADSLIGKNGVKAVKRDANAGVTTIVCDDGAVLRFDFETDAEMQTRKAKEAAEAQKKKAAADAKKAQKQREDAELHEACKSTLEKVVEWVFDLFR